MRRKAAFYAIRRVLADLGAAIVVCGAMYSLLWLWRAILCTVEN